MTAWPQHFKPAMEHPFSVEGRYDSRTIADVVGSSMRELADLTHGKVSVLGRNSAGDRLQPGLRPVVIVLDLSGSTDAAPEAVCTWLHRPIPGLGYRAPLDMRRAEHTAEPIDTVTRGVDGVPA